MYVMRWLAMRERGSGWGLRCEPPVVRQSAFDDRALKAIAIPHSEWVGARDSKGAATPSGRCGVSARGNSFYVERSPLRGERLVIGICRFCPLMSMYLQRIPHYNICSIAALRRGCLHFLCKLAPCGWRVTSDRFWRARPSTLCW